VLLMQVNVLVVVNIDGVLAQIAMVLGRVGDPAGRRVGIVGEIPYVILVPEDQ
jgi:hypothetical protein